MNKKEKILFELLKKYAFNVISAPKGKLKHSFVEPGLAYHNTLWDWDSYWSIYSLNDIVELLKNDKDFDYSYYRKLVNEAAKGDVLNFIDFMESDGFTPIMLRCDVINDTYCSKENVKNSLKGYLIKSALLACKLNNDYSFIDVNKLCLYLKYLKENQFDKKTGLFYYISDIMIGVDNNPTVFGRLYSSSADILFNSTMVDEYNSLIEIMKMKNLDYSFYEKEKNNLINSIYTHAFDKKDNIFYSQDINVKNNETEVFNKGLKPFWNSIPLKIEFFGCYAPYAFNFANKSDVKKAFKHLKNGGLLSKYGVRSLSKYEKMYNLEPSGNPSNWLGAIWGVSSYFIFKAYLNYGYKNKAKQIYKKTLNTYYKGILENGSMSESYNPENGKGILHTMFFSFNMLIASMKNELKNC